MPTLTMRALVALTSRGQAIVPGETFTPSPAEAAAFLYQGRAVLVVDPTMEPSVETPRRRRTYRRRDMNADAA